MNFKIRKLIENNQILMVLSLVCAIGFWFSVVYSVDNKSNKFIQNVPVVVNVENTVPGRLELSPFVAEDFFIDVEIAGERAVVGNISQEEILVRPVFSSVTAPGLYELRLEAVDFTNRGFEVVEIKPSTVQIRFDHIVTKKFPIEVELLGFSIPEGYIMNQEYISPKEVTIKGPAAEIALIDKCAVEVALEQPVSNTSTFDRDIQMYKLDGTVVKSAFLEMDIGQTSVTIPVLKKKEVPITLGFTNIPAGFDMETLHYSITPSILEVAGPSEMMDGLYEIHLGYIDMRTLTPDMSVYYGAVLPTGYIAVDNIQDVTVEFQAEDYISKKFKVSDIKLINLPTEYSIVANTKAITNVEIYGPPDEINKLTDNSIIAEIDISNIDIKVGQIVVPVDIAIPTSSSSWAFGEYTAVVTVKNK